MGIKTEDFVRNIPPKEVTDSIDWLGILDSFEATALEEKYINECARRNSYDTCYRWDTPSRPIEERLGHSEWSVKNNRQKLESCVHRIENEGLSPLTYKLARGALIKQSVKRVRQSITGVSMNGWERSADENRRRSISGGRRTVQSDVSRKSRITRMPTNLVTISIILFLHLFMRKWFVSARG